MNFEQFLLALAGKLGLLDFGLFALIWGMTFVGALYTFLAYDYHGEKRTLRGFVRFCLPMRVVTARQTRLDLFYAVTMKLLRTLWRWAFLSNLAVAYVIYAGLSLLFGPRGTPLHAPSAMEQAAFIAGAIVAIDFVTFYAHYLAHKKGLWELHKIHHSALSLTPFTEHRFHPLQELWDSWWVNLGAGSWVALFAYARSLPLADVTILGIDAYFLTNCFAFYHLRHSHIHMRYPAWLERAFLSPAQHQLHHSREERHWDRNFGLLLSCWDQLFGTIAYSEPEPTRNLGLDVGQKEYMTIRNLYVMPFVQAGRAAERAWMRRRARTRPVQIPAPPTGSDGRLVAGLPPAE
jgi:sterol desaturase/sphingolipid hydroxylase (fatty acid hydroxylase superfamily)